MADAPISGLPPAGAITGSEIVPVIQSGTTVRTTITAFLASALNRAAHTGTQAMSTVTGLVSALNAKADDSAVVHDTGNEPVAGVKTFSSSPIVPDASWSIAKTTGLQAALDLKALDSAVAHDTGNETWAGVKTFSSSPVVPDGSFSIAKTTGLQAALDAKVPIAGLRVTEGANAKQGVSTLVAGTVTVANTSVTVNSRIFLTVQSLGTVALPQPVCVTARVVGTSFTITSADVTDTSVVAWEIAEPA